MAWPADIKDPHMFFLYKKVHSLWCYSASCQNSLCPGALLNSFCAGKAQSNCDTSSSQMGHHPFKSSRSRDRAWRLLYKNLTRYDKYDMALDMPLDYCCKTTCHIVPPPHPNLLPTRQRGPDVKDTGRLQTSSQQVLVWTGSLPGFLTDEIPASYKGKYETVDSTCKLQFIAIAPRPKFVFVLRQRRGS